MKWSTTPQFTHDWEKLPNEHRQLFRECVPGFSTACDAFLESPESFRWPARLRVKPMKSAPGVWEMTWSFSGPDGRATFEFVRRDAEVFVRWRRIGSHDVFGSA